MRQDNVFPTVSPASPVMSRTVLARHEDALDHPREVPQVEMKESQKVMIASAVASLGAEVGRCVTGLVGGEGPALNST